MPLPFPAFLDAFRAAIAAGDTAFIKPVYQPWVDSSGMIPAEYLDSWPDIVLGQLGDLAAAEPTATETFDGYGVATWGDPAADEGSTSLTFEETPAGWIMWNERSNFTAFAKVYTLWYDITGGRVAIRLNGRRSPLITEMTGDTANATISPINASLQVGDNDLTLEPLAGTPTVRLRIGSALEGEIADSAAGDVVAFEREVGGKESLAFAVE